MGRMKHGKPNPHNDKKKVVLKKDEVQKRKPKEIDPEFQRRQLESNHSRYDEPIHSDSDDELDQPDETKSIEYIKKYYSGVGAHFQFDDEKEWRSDKNSSEYLTNLNLNRLSNEISRMTSWKILQLQETDSSFAYCIQNLSICSGTNEDHSTEKEEDDSLTDSTVKHYSWSYQDVEQYKDSNIDMKTSLRESVGVNLHTTVAEPQVNRTLNGANEAEMVPVETKPGSIESVATKKVAIDDDSSLDELLIEKSDEEPANEKMDLKEAGAQELDDWLDSII